MTAPLHQRGQVLILLATYMFFGGATSIALLYVPGAAPRELKAALDAVVIYAPRRTAAKSEIDQWAKALKAQAKALGKAQEKIVKLARRQDATRMEADGIAASVDASISAMDSGFLDARFRLKGHLTQTEWDATWAYLEKQ